MNDIEYLGFAYGMAKQSPDPSTQNGAIIVLENKIIAKGCNEFPHGVAYNAERWERPLKYSYVEHAERNAIYDAARQGVSTRGATMYCPWFACADCARAIIQSGIKRVMGHAAPVHQESGHWGDLIKIAYEMFDEAGIEYENIPYHIGVKIRFNGELVIV